MNNDFDLNNGSYVKVLENHINALKKSCQQQREHNEKLLDKLTLANDIERILRGDICKLQKELDAANRKFDLLLATVGEKTTSKRRM